MLAGETGHRRRTLTFTVAAATIAACISAVVVVTSSPEQEAPASITLPDDDVRAPSDAEAKIAIAAAKADRIVAPKLEGRTRAVLKRWHSGAPCAQRCIATIFYQYATDTLLEVYTTPAGAVVASKESTGQPPVSPDEQVRAHEIAEADRLVRRSLRGEQHSHGAIAYSLYPDGPPCDVRRCATVIFMLDDYAATGRGRQLQVLVDLSREQVLNRLYQRCAADGCEVHW